VTQSFVVCSLSDLGQAEIDKESMRKANVFHDLAVIQNYLNSTANCAGLISQSLPEPNLLKSIIS
jgi:hypothetical protein